MLISIIVPIYNAGHYIKECIKSLTEQTYKNIEMIVIDDGSTDDSLKIVKDIASLDSRIKLFTQNNSGVSSARNLGIEKAEGEWITFVDGDDWIEPNTCELALSKAQEVRADIVVWSYFKNYKHKEYNLNLLGVPECVFESNKDVLLLRSIYGNYKNKGTTETVSAGTVWGKLYKSELLKNEGIRFVNGLTRAQDTVFNINVMQKAERIYYFDKSLYHYRITNTSTCSGSRYIEDTNKPFDLLLEKFKTFIELNNYGNEYEEALKLRTVQVIMWHLKHKYNNPSYNKSLLERRKGIINLINTAPYKNALQSVNTAYLPKKERLMARMFRMRLIISYLFILNLHENIFTKNRKH